MPSNRAYVFLTLLTCNSAIAAERPSAFLPAGIVESFAASTIAQDIIGEQLHRPSVAAKYCGVNDDKSGSFLVIASPQPVPGPAAAALNCGSPLQSLKSAVRTSLPGPLLLIRLSTSWSAQILTAKSTECLGDGVSTEACAKIAATVRQYRTDDIKTEAEGRSVTVAVAPEFQATGVVLRLLTGSSASGDLTFADFAIPPLQDTLVSFPVSWLNSDIFVGEYPLKATDGVSGTFTVRDSKVNSSDDGVSYSARVTPQGSADQFDLTFSLSKESLTATTISVAPKVATCSGSSLQCNLQNTARRLAAQLAETRLAQFVGRPFRPSFEHVPIKLTWSGTSYGFFGKVTNGASGANCITLALAWSISSTGGR